MRVPKIIYHGTTMLRWGFIKRNGLLRSDMAKTWKAQEYLGLDTGYVYLSSNVYEATMYGLNKSLQDMTYLDIPENLTLNPNYRDSVVLGINASKLDIEIDPLGETEGIKQIRNTKNENPLYDYKNVQWYRYKGDIKLKHLFVYKYVPFDTFSSNIINEFMKINERKAQQAQYLEKFVK